MCTGWTEWNRKLAGRSAERSIIKWTLNIEVKWIQGSALANWTMKGQACSHNCGKSLSALWVGWRNRYSDWLQNGRSGDRIPVRTRFSTPVQTGPGTYPASSRYRVFPGGKERPGRDADPSPLLVPRSWKSRAILLLTLRVVRPVQSLSACTRVHFTLPFTISFVMFVCLSILLFVSVKELISHWADFYEIWYLRIFRKCVEKFQVLLKSGENTGLATCRPM